MPASPDVENLSLLTGIAYVKRIDEDADYVDVGECSAFTQTITPDKLDYFSKRGPAARSKVKSVTREKTVLINFTMNEFTARNLRVAMMGGAIEQNSDGDSEFSIASVDQQLHQVKLVGTNEVGNQVEVEFWRVDLTPSGELALLPDEWGEMAMQGECLFDSAKSEYGRAILRDQQSA